MSRRAVTIRVERALRAAGMYIWSWESKSRLVSCTRSAQELLGLAPGPRRRPLSFYEPLVHCVDRPLLTATIGEALRGAHAPLEATFRIALPGTGAQRWLTARGRLHRDEATQHLTLAGVLWQTTPCRATANVMHHFLDVVCSSWQ
jgi:hypothetical protein